MKRSKAVRYNTKSNKWQKKYLEKAKVILDSNDSTTLNAIESTIEVLFESVTKEFNRINNYGR